MKGGKRELLGDMYNGKTNVTVKWLAILVFIREVSFSYTYSPSPPPRTVVVVTSF